ncbi:MAG TPA: HD domain-containing protein [Anaeromyxobacteraceae bacterium]|nr:HD domain-containing protein [Anaeromyxobacteraceae bacterium]
MNPTILGERFRDAMVEALRLHARQERKGSRVPYMTHLLGTAAAVLHFGGDEDQAIAGLLHDAAEDQGGQPTLEAIRQKFGERVAEIVEGCTDTFEEKKPAWKPRKQAYIAKLAQEPKHVLLVSAADKLDNARAIVADLRQSGAKVWSRFNGGIDSLWYYRALVEAYQQAKVGPIALELEAAVSEMERLAAGAKT